MLLARFLHVGTPRHLGDRDVPPALVVRYALVAVGGHVDDHGSIDGFRRYKGITKVVYRPRTEYVRAETLSIQGQVHRQRITFVRTRVVAEGPAFSMAIPG